MKHKAIHFALGLLFSFWLCLGLTACIGEERHDNTPLGNFEQLWRIIDERYCFLEEKNIDWDSVYRAFRPRITPDLSPKELFDQLSEMLAVLKDGHVNLSSADRVSSYADWYQDHPWNFREDILQTTYLGRVGTGFRQVAGMKYKIFDNNIGYIRYESFMSSPGEGNLDEVLNFLSICNGLIVDVRDNGGGMLTNSHRIAARFTNERVLVGYIRHKTGKGHTDFSKPEPVYMNPSSGIRWQKPMVVLTNRRCYSATNDFVNAMNSIESGRIILLGDRTGGGSGLPFTAELPNGWAIRFSASPHYDPQLRSIENGIDPDIFVNMLPEDLERKRDTLLERAFEVLAQ